MISQCRKRSVEFLRKYVTDKCGFFFLCIIIVHTEHCTADCFLCSIIMSLAEHVNLPYTVQKMYVLYASRNIIHYKTHRYTM